MNYIRRAFTSIINKPIQSLVIMGIVAILSTAMLSSFLVFKTTENIQNAIKEELGAYATIESNLDGPMNIEWNENSLESNQLALELIEILEESKKHDSILNVDYKIGLDQENIKNNHNDIEFYGISTVKIEELDKQDIIITEGRFFFEEELETKQPVVVLQDSEDNEEIAVGEFLKLEYVAYGFNHDRTLVEIETYPLEVKVIGKFKVNPLIEDMGCKPLQVCWYNKSLIPGKVLVEITNHINDIQINYAKENNLEPNGISYMVRNVLIEIDQVDHLDEVEANLQSMIETSTLNSDFIKVKTSSDAFDSISGPVKNIGYIGKLFLMSSLISSIIVFTLLFISLTINRKKEVGVYLSLGVSSKGIRRQFIFEFLFISFIALIISIFLSRNIVKKLSWLLTQNHLIQGSTSKMFYLSFNEILLIFALVILPIMVASMTSIFIITRYQPKEILS